MIFHHWTPDASYKGPEEGQGGECFSTPEHFMDPKMAFCHVGLRFCCEIEAGTWEEAMVQYHDHMCWEDYKPMKEE